MFKEAWWPKVSYIEFVELDASVKCIFDAFKGRFGKATIRHHCYDFQDLREKVTSVKTNLRGYSVSIPKVTKQPGLRNHVYTIPLPDYIPLSQPQKNYIHLLKYQSKT